MDEGPFRTSRQSTDRSAENEPASKPAEQPKKTYAEPKPVHRSSQYSRTEEKSKKPLFIAIGAVVAVILIGIIVWAIIAGSNKSSALPIDTNKYQAVFFTNGNVYFGKLQSYNDEYLKLTNVYYPKTQSKDATDTKTQQQETDSQNNVTLIKLSDEIHGPENEMMIAKDQVQFYQNLRSDSKVSKLIENEK